MREYTVLIADDEPLIREGLAALIRQSGLPFKVTAQVLNGKMALERMKEEYFDLAITDIEMPDMDGLALIRRSRDAGYSTRFIVLSGFDRFDYARSAYRFGVEDYLLKPVHKQELHETLGKSLEGLNRERPIQSLWNQFFINPKDRGIRKDLGRLYQDTRGWYYVLLLGTTPLSRLRFPSEYLLVDEDEPYTLGLLLNDDGGRGASLNEQLMELSSELLLMDLRLSYYTGERVLRYWDLPASRKQAWELRPLLFYRERNGIISYGERAALIWEGREREVDRIFAVLADAGDACLAGKPFEDYLDCFRQEIGAMRFKPAVVRMKVQQFLYGLLPILENSGLNAGELTDKYRSLFSPESDLTLTELIMMLKDLMHKIGVRREKPGSGHSALIEEIQANIRKNYMLDLNLQDLSEKYRMNKAYLGQLFKKHAGASFLTYLNNVRLEEARRLLDTTDLKVYEIAYQVGYRDPSYFMSRFEKKTGLTPLVYRKSKGAHSS